MNASRDVWAVVPVKEFEGAKCRLATRYSPEFRRELARAMLEDVLQALAAVPAIAGIVVVSADRSVHSLIKRFGLRIFEDDACAGHTAAVMAAARRLANEGRYAMLTVPGDIPAVTATEIASLLSLHQGTSAFTIAPSHDRRGSNAIVVSKPDAVTLAFGDGSFVRHLAAARTVGIEPAIASLAGVAVDIDNPADLARLRRGPMGVRTSAFLSACLPSVSAGEAPAVPHSIP